MSGGIPSLALKDEDVTKFLASSTHLGTNNLDFQMEQYVFKRRSDGESSPKPKKQFVDCRRSTAAQFFAEETDQESVCPEMVVQLINDANDSNEENIVLKNLKIVQDIIVNKVPKLLDNFLDEVVSFQQNTNNNIRVFVIKFIESVCKQMPQFFPKLVGNLDLMLQDPSMVVQKTVIQAAIILYPLAIRWICEAKHIDDVMVATWSLINELKCKVCVLLESDNDGLRVMSLKFMEHIVIIQTAKDEYYSQGLSLDDIPFVLEVFKPRKLEEEAKDVFQRIVNFQGTTHISGFNLMTCMQVLTTVARKRCSFFSKVLQAFESLHANLPPTLGQSQVSSVRKFLKLQLFTLAKHPRSKEFRSLISIMLSDLGATAQQINKYFPGKDKWSPKKSRSSPSAKKQTVLKKFTDENLASKKDCVVSSCKATAIDITAEDIFPKLTNINVSDLVLVSMLSLPDDMPSHFQSSYTPIAAAGTDPQVRHLARLISSQLNVAGLGKGVEWRVDEQGNMDASDEEEGTETMQIETVLNLTTAKKEQKKQPLLLIPSGNFQPKIGKLSKDIDFQIPTGPFSLEESEKLCKSAYRRILDAEKAITKKGASPIRVKILTALASQFGGIFDSELKSYILESPRNRLELAFSWLYQEYSFYKGFEGPSESDAEKYEKIVNYLLKSLLENDEQNSNLCRFFLDLPNVTEGMAECLKVLIGNEDMTDQALEIAKNMSLDRPPQKLLFLSVMCDLTLHDKTSVCSKAIDAVVGLYENGYMKSFIEAFALRSLKFLLDNTPQSSSLIIFQTLPEAWSDELIRVCLNLSFALLPYNHSLINDIGNIYVKTSADVKRTILRGLEVPVKQITMTSPELLSFVENCPQGAETLVTRIIHILTDKALPSIELVARVRDLYQKRVPDVRFLIPIINGLTKREVISALPELIKLNPTVVKEVFHRLVGSNFTSPLSPAELMVALHNIDTSQCSLKVIIKATSLCFEEKHIFTQVVLAMVMQQLMEQNPLPVLLMRTVIQSLLNHPHLLGFVTNILQRLTLKEVWKYPKIWEGFIKCCQRTKPQSFQVLLQLPPPQLKEVITTYADLCDPLVEYVNSFTENQKSHISEGVLKVLEAVPGNSAAYSANVVDNAETPGEPLPPGEESA